MLRRSNTSRKCFIWQRENAALERTGENRGYGDMTPPRSLGRCAPAVRLRRALPAHEWLDKETKRKSGRAEKGYGVAVFL